MFIVEDAIEAYAHQVSQSEPELLLELADETRRTLDMPQMLTGRLEGRLLKSLVMLSGAKHIIEIGTFSGYSALSMAEGLPEDGKLITCDINPKSAAVAQSYFDRSPHGKKIELRLGPALETLESLSGPFDLAFIDADKANYGNYYEALLPKIKTGGVLLFDNALWSGQVLDPKDADSKAIDQLNRTLKEDPRVENVMLTVRDGVHLVRKV